MKFIIEMPKLIDTSILLRTISTTTAHVEKAQVDPSTGKYIPFSTYDTLKVVDPSTIPPRDYNVNRPDTHLHVNIEELNKIIATDPNADKKNEHGFYEF